ncbi:MAG TPA: hypothetical protein VEF37_02775 [Thermodesulfovibrionales bacterium]|nr:hypothetical protein [Thermodesulfovibrionales bacterium]
MIRGKLKTTLYAELCRRCILMLTIRTFHYLFPTGRRPLRVIDPYVFIVIVENNLS